MMVASMIGLRYTGSRSRKGFISLVSLVSFLGLVLGVVALIVVVSVMNGFDRELKQRILSAVPHMVVTGENPAVVSRALAGTGIESVSVFQEAQLMLIAPAGNSLVLVHGIDIESSPGHHYAEIQAQLKRHQEGGIVLGEGAARRLGLLPGDPVQLVVPAVSSTGATLRPRLAQALLLDTFSLGSELDYTLAYMAAADLAQVTRQPLDVRVTFDDLFSVPVHTRMLTGLGFQVEDWTLRYGDFFSAVKMEKIMMFVLLTFVIAVASFSIVSGLSMLVDNKRRDIAVLRTMGLSNGGVLGIFMLQGMLISGLGILTGVILGLPMAWFAPELMDYLARLSGISIIEGTYFNQIPTDVRPLDVGIVVLVALVISFLATLYPSVRASRLDPAVVLRYE